MRGPAQLLPPLVAAALAVATVVEALAALRVLRPVGAAPGEAPLVLDVAVWAAEIGIVLAFALCARAAFTRRSSRWLALLPPLAALALLAHSLGFDPYVAPSLIRFTEEERGDAHLWLAGIAAVALLAGLLIRRFPRSGSAVGALVLLVVTGTYLLVGAGH